MKGVNFEGQIPTLGLGQAPKKIRESKVNISPLNLSSPIRTL